ncbi:hypothetical protein THASP1DRAFT_25954 [Thamnocephalis sphaerospora]|uniref:3-hydroxyisobutyrate dehydrogenase-like NAD-binding domain-containing protein n=1 Tax=Thamnocephalis sphaerospora TaxID=78915 RepID=A0A4P9XK23_9FUNG|nr:hypothetical protein THASP1DRAFT_25954 [Thamnocephalis sphaerospora]|eukprot:RKP05570.1 hypothetical protein THASP1DRAFT_25954 [Thamnocephalis sphaerospora]
MDGSTTRLHLWQEFIDHMFPTDLFRHYGRRMAEDTFRSTAAEPDNKPGFTVRLAQKDLGHILNLAESHGAGEAVPVARLARQHLDQLAAAGHADDWEWSGIVSSVRSRRDDASD